MQFQIFQKKSRYYQQIWEKNKLKENKHYTSGQKMFIPGKYSTLTIIGSINSFQLTFSAETKLAINQEN